MTVTLTISERPSKLSPSNTRTMINDVKSSPQITSRELQTSLAASEVSVYVYNQTKIEWAWHPL